ncbi:MAG: glycosyltransferase family 1 protein [Acidobacteria bacterium]|nr:glycosyltransferase family 1 protein [Acidobacteriota bacterium]
MRIAINAIASTAGGGRTYLRHLVAWLQSRERDEFELWVPDGADFQNLAGHIRIRTSRLARSGFLGRLVWEQVVLPWRLWREGTQVLLCVGNFCPYASPVPVVLVSANALYFSQPFLEDLWRRRHFRWIPRHLLKGEFVLGSARAAEAVITPTQAMGDALSRALGAPPRRWHASWFGHQARENEPPATPLLPARTNELRFVIVSFYNYFRNFETVFRALALIRKTTDLNIRLLLTTELRPGLKLGGYDTTQAYELMHELGIASQITCLGHVPYADLPRVHASVDGLIAAGYVESFSFTLLEGMAAGLPVLASDIPTHREVGGDAALYFQALDPSDLASQWERLARDPRLRQRLAAAGRERARLFDWASHFETVFRTVAEVAA